MSKSILVSILVCASLIAAEAAELRGKVIHAASGSARVEIEGTALPQSGDPTSIYFKLPGSEDEVLVGRGKVSAVEGDIVSVKLDDPTVTPQREQLARITSQRPQSKAAAPTARPAAAAATPEPTASTASSPSALPTLAPMPTASPAAARFPNFNDYPYRDLTPTEFAQFGIARMSCTGGRIVTQDVDPGMVVPKGTKRVLTIRGGDPVTTLTLEFAPPIRRFTMKRIGGNPTSLPNWRLEAIGADGKVMEAINDTRGGSGEPRIRQPREFSIGNAKSLPISTIRLIVDNREGASTWATYSTLPLISMRWEVAAGGSPFATTSDLTRNERNLLVGDWKGARHVTRFSADGTFAMANPGDPVYPLGTWRLEGDKLIQKFKDQPESANTIVTLNKTQLVLRDAKGTVYKSTRVAR